MLERCSVLDWAACGAMALTGFPGEPPVASPAAAFGLLGQVTERLAEATRAVGTQVRADPAELIAGRAALMGLARRGQVSAGGSSRLLRAADGWCAITLSRATDREAIPAVLGSLGFDAADADGSADTARGTRAESGTELGGGAWLALKSAARAHTATELATAAQLLGVPAAALPAWPGPPDDTGPSASASWPPWRGTRIAPADSGGRLAGAVVVDLSSMWAGPLCARLLGLAGATVIKVESPGRPDGARTGNREFYDWLHAGHRSAAIDFRGGRDTLRGLLESADIVIEASRPRALENLGLAPGTIAHEKGQVWVSITGYGRCEPDRVAFGDDAAVAGGLVGWASGRIDDSGNGSGGDGCGGKGFGVTEPVFCADAIADPLTGVCAALAVTQSLAEGGGHLIDLPMRGVAAAFANAPGPDHGPHEVKDDVVTCHASGQVQRVLPPRRPAAPGKTATDFGADTEAVLAWLAARAC